MTSRACTMALVACLSAFGCVPSPPPSQFPTAGVALERMRATGSCSRAVQGEATLDFYGLGQRMRGSLLYMAAAPSKLRFDVYSPFGVTLSTLTSDGSKFALYDLQGKTFSQGPAKTCNVRRFTQVPVPPSALVELLRGQAPVLAHTEGDASIEWESSFFGGGAFLVKLRGQHSASEEIELTVPDSDWDKPYSDQRVRVLGVRVSQAGEELYEAELSGHETALRKPPDELTAEERALGLGARPQSGPPCDAELPRRVRISVASTGQDLVFRNDQVWHNPPLTPGVFRQAAPAGVRVKEAICSD